MRTFLLILLCLTAPLTSAPAQSKLPTEILISQDKDWRVHLGDNPAFAAPTFDDSTWDPAAFGIDLPASLNHGSSRWFRKRLDLPAEAGPVDLLLIGTKGSFEVYIDGQQVGDSIQSSLRWRKSQELIFPLHPLTGSNSVEVAIRSHLYESEFNEISFEEATIGSPAATKMAARAHQGTRVGKLVFPVAILVSTTIAALLLLALFYQQPARREYLWLGISLLFFALTISIPAIDIYGGAPYSWNAFLGDPCTYFFMATQLEFIYRFMGRSPGGFVRSYQAALILVPLALTPCIGSACFCANQDDHSEDDDR